jgi:peptidoglycan/LPS O-acetylase OafA/YrhL
VYTIFSAPDRSAPGRPHLAALDGLRFVAAMHIVLFHTLHVGWLRPVNWGSTSTSFFFVLSGFVLAYAYGGEDGGLRVSARDFWWRRFARLYPLAILAQLAVIPFAWHSYAPGERAVRAVAVLSGLQGWFPTIADSFNSPGWSVPVLAFCYLAFPLLMSALRGWPLRRLALALGAVWLWCLLPTMVALWMDAGAYWWSALHHHPLSRLPEFVFGVVPARLFVAAAHLRVPRGTTPAALALLGAALLLLPYASFPLAHNGLLAPLHGLLIVGLAGGGGVVARVLSLRVTRQLGHASFALFLVHVPVYAWVMMPLAPTVTRMPLPVRMAVYAGYLALTVLTAWGVQRWVADPIARVLHRRGPVARPAADPGGAPLHPAVARS